MSRRQFSLKCSESPKPIRLRQVVLVCATFILALCFDAGQNCFAQEGDTKPALSPLRRVAAVLGRPVRTLRLLDRRPLVFAFLKGKYEIFVVRDLITNETLEIALDLNTWRRIVPAELRKRDRERATVEGRKLEPQLLDLLLRHADLSKIEVRLYFSLELVRRPEESPQRDWLEPDLREQFQTRLDAELRELGIDVPLRVRPDFPVLEATLSAPQVVKLAASPLIQSIALAGEPEIPD